MDITQAIVITILLSFAVMSLMGCIQIGIDKIRSLML